MDTLNIMNQLRKQDPAIRSIQARFDVNNPDLAAFKKTLRKSRPYVFIELQDDGQHLLLSRFENGRNAFTVSKDAINVVRPVKSDDETWLGYYFNEKDMSVNEAVEAFKSYVKSAVEAKRLEHSRALARLDKDMSGFVTLGLDD